MPLMTREDAHRMVDPVTILIAETYQAVSMEDAAELLGDRLAMLLDDPVRKHGPTPDTIYPWNIVDYLSHDNPRAGSRSVRLTTRS
jgi:hypothetical protein